ncbi:hypothetical protein OH77DRAFT_1524085 [Trametes cingulata]|nr:hypothetical protein OH77DRAFT_1524085 [Trametes cingulata]
MSNRKDTKSAHPNAPSSSEPHGISFTLMEPTPPNSPNLGGSFPGSQTKQSTKSKLSGTTPAQNKKN